MRIDEAIQVINDSANHKVLSRLTASDIELHPSKGVKTTICVLDLETTGLEANQSEAIEIGAIKADINEDGHVTKIYQPLSMLNQPSAPITELITQITGITNEMVKGQTFDTAAINEYVSDVDWIVAHNASFDRPFAERISNVFETKKWLCSAKEPKWHEEGFESFKLEYLNYKFLKFYEGHRATTDCYATLYVLNQKSTDGRSMLKKGLDEAGKEDVELFATGSPFETKDILKGRGYRWNDGSSDKPKSWSYTADAPSIINEIAFLNKAIYSFPKSRFEIMVGNAFNRHSERTGQYKNVSATLEE